MPHSKSRIVIAIAGWIALAAVASQAFAAGESAPVQPATAKSVAPQTETKGDLPPGVLAKNRWMEITRADWDHAISGLPENMRWEFATSPKRVQDILNNLLLVKTLAAQARADGVQPEAVDQPRRAAEDRRPVNPDQAFANAELRHLAAASAKAFDADKAGFEKKAREIYTVDVDKYKLPEQRVFSDIAVSIATHGDDGAKARAAEARAKIAAGGDWNAITREYSDDPTTKDKGGKLPPLSDSQLPSDIKDGLLALKRPGDISEPLKTDIAWHIARLDAIDPPRTQSFDEVKGSIMEKLRAQYIAAQRTLRFTEINRDPTLKVNQAAVDALVNRVDANGKPIRSEPQAPAPAGAPAAPAEK